MILGSCPYDDCDGPLWLPITEGDLPQYERHECETCERWIWTRHSRWDPWSLTEAEFLEQYTVDQTTKKIAPKSGSVRISL